MISGHQRVSGLDISGLFLYSSEYVFLLISSDCGLSLALGKLCQVVWSATLNLGSWFSAGKWWIAPSGFRVSYWPKLEFKYEE